MGVPRFAESALAERLGLATYVAEPGPIGRWLYVSSAVSRILGFTAEQLQADPALWMAHIHPDDRGTVLAQERSAADTCGRVCSEYRVIRPDGEVVWVLDDAVLEEGPHGEGLLHGFLLDITTRKRTELKLAAHVEIVEAVAAGAELATALTLLVRAVERLSGPARCVVETDDLTATGAPGMAVGSLGVDLPDVGRDAHGPVLTTPIHSATGTVLGRLVLRYPPGVQPPVADEDLPEWAAQLAALAIVRAGEHHQMASSVALLSATLESTDDGILVVDRTGRIVGHNPTFARMWGIDPHLLESGNDARVMASVLEQLVDPSAFVARVQQLYAHPDLTTFDELTFHDGRVFERYSQPERVGDTITGRVWSFRDVTEKRRLQTDLHDSQDNLRLLVAQIRDVAIYNLDPTGRVTTWNAGAQQIKGYTEQDILGQHFSVFYPEGDVAAGKPERQLETARLQGQAVDEGWRIRKDGSRFWASAVLTALHDQQGQLRGFGKVTRDVTERHAAELALQHQARTLELLSTVAAASNSAIGVEQALSAALESFARFGGWQLAHAYLTDHDDPTTLAHSVWYEQTPGAFGGFRDATQALATNELSLVHAMLSNPSPVYLSPLKADPRFVPQEAASQAGLVATCAFPILIGREPVGVLEFFSSQAMEPPEDLLQIMDQVGTQLGRVVERHRAELRQTRHAQQLEQLSTQLETVLNSAGEGIYGLDTSRRITFINHAGAALLGRSRTELVGRLEAEVVPTEPDHDADMPDTTGRRNISRHRRADGTHFESESIAAPIVQDGQHAGTVVVFRDISERRALERLKNQFISVVSHELRTPLTSIRGALGLLDGGVAGPLPPRATRMVRVAMTSTDRLIRLITDILDVERIAAGQLALHHEDVQARALIATAVEETAVLATERDVRVAVGDTPGVVLADPDRVIQILTNLVGNAVKFSPARSTVELSTTVSGHEVRFDVADHGRGVDPRDLEVIFEPFRQADSSDTRHHGGSGLGLAICRGLVEQHGGTIGARPTAGGGATFSFTLPAGDRRRVEGSDRYR